MNDKLVSVIVPSYNHEKYIKSTLKSIYTQTYANIELIILDDESPDNSVDVVYSIIDTEKYKRRFNDITFLKNKNQGLLNSLNQGFKLSKGDFVAQIASDDLFLPNHIEIAVRELSKDPKFGLFFSNPNIIDGNTITSKPLMKNPNYIKKITLNHTHLKELLFKNFLPGSTIVYKKEVFEKCGYMDPLLINRGEISLHWKIATLYDFAFINECTGYYRTHGDSTWKKMVKDLERLKIDYIKLIKNFQDSDYCKNNNSVERAIEYINYDYEKNLWKSKAVLEKTIFILKNINNVFHDINKKI